MSEGESIHIPPFARAKGARNGAPDCVLRVRTTKTWGTRRVNFLAVTESPPTSPLVSYEDLRINHLEIAHAEPDFAVNLFPVRIIKVF